jgi:hypothetical protein
MELGILVLMMFGAEEILNSINSQTLGQLVKGLGEKLPLTDNLDQLFSIPLSERNGLSHHFYRQHNIPRNSESGREIMLKDLELIHEILLNAYKAALLVSRTDIDILLDDAAS